MARYIGLVAAFAVSGALANLTPEKAIAAPRRGVAVPNHSGSIAVFATTQYSFEEESTSVWWNLLDLKTGNITDSGFNSSEVNEIVWLPGSETGIIYINATNEETPGGVTLWLGDISDPSKGKLVASLDAPFSGLKVANTSSGDLHFLVNSLAYPNGTAYNEELVPAPLTSGRLYSDVYVRHWDTWLTKERYAVFAGALLKDSSYGLAQHGVRNVLQGINFTVTRPESPVQPFGGSGDYDISPDGSTYAFLSKATHLNKASFTASYIYVGSFNGSEPAVPINGPESEANKAGHKGASGAPTFSPDSSKLVYFQQDGEFYESDRNKAYVVEVSQDGSAVSTSNWKGLVPDWDRSPDSVQWAPDSGSFYTTAEDYARVRVFKIPVSTAYESTPKNLTDLTSVAGISVLPDESLLVSASAVWSPRDFYIVAADGSKSPLFSSTDADEGLEGLGPHTYSDIFFKGSLPDFDQKLHAAVVKPSFFKENETYPLVLFVHGGPQGMNANSWSGRSNLQTWADQGYVVVAPNPTGSTGFGQELIDRIQGEYGNWPYKDLVLCWEYVKDNLAFVDTDNGIAFGPSFGGFMMNWIQGHDLGRKFKSLVTHDGISNTKALYGTEELWFIRHDFEGAVYDTNATSYDKWNPLNHVANWSTPHFVVHNSMDYRLPESDGLALFNILQSKGIPSRFLNFPDENHWVLNPENSLFWHTEIFNWINHWAQGKPLDDVAIGE